MPSRNALSGSLGRSKETTISVIGRKSGRAISLLIWFVLDDDALYLLPARGSDTQWYKNVLSNGSIQIGAKGAKTDLKVAVVTDAKHVSLIIEKFRAKYGDSGIKLYKKLDVALVAPAR